MLWRKPSEVQFIDADIKQAFEDLKNGTSEEKKLHEW